MRKPHDVVLCGSGPAARDLFLDARDRARADRVAIGWTASRYRLEYADRIVDWVPVRSAAVHIRGMSIRNIHVDAGVPAELLTDDVLAAILPAQLSSVDTRHDWTFGDRQVQIAVQRRRGDLATVGSEPAGGDTSIQGRATHPE